MDANVSRNFSYYEAPKIAMEMVDGINPAVFYDSFSMGGRKINVLNYKGVKILAGITGSRIEELECVETEKGLEIKCKATNPRGDNGFSFIFQSKTAFTKGKMAPDPTYREKAYTRAKRNALRDIVPDQIFCELLVNASRPNARPKQQMNRQVTESESIAAISDVDKKRTEVRIFAVEQTEKLMEVWGLTVQDCIDHVELIVGKSLDEWTVENWETLRSALEDPVGSKMEQAVEVAESAEDEKEVEETEESADADAVEADAVGEGEVADFIDAL